jgi:hypothetical protein
MKKNASFLFVMAGIITVTPANSPYTITTQQADCSRLGSELLVIVSGGAVELRLPLITSIQTQTSNIVIQGSTAAGNVTITPSGTDVLGGVIGAASSAVYACGNGKGITLEANSKGAGKYCWFITGDKTAIS